MQETIDIAESTIKSLAEKYPQNTWCLLGRSLDEFFIVVNNKNILNDKEFPYSTFIQCDSGHIVIMEDSMKMRWGTCSVSTYKDGKQIDELEN